jgi:hypothetical protein
MSDNCYFWIDESIPHEERKISVFCIKCRNEKRPDIGWFWEGAKLGYGPFNFICCICGHKIHPVEKEIDENDN